MIYSCIISSVRLS